MVRVSKQSFSNHLSFNKTTDFLILTKRRMPMIPEKKSKKWLQILISYFLIILIALTLSRYIVGTPITLRILISTIILAFVSAAIPSLGGFFGRKIFFYVFTLINIFAILYMMFVIVTDASPGWTDITSMIIYLFVTSVGLFVAIIVDLIHYFITKHNTKS